MPIEYFTVEHPTLTELLHVFGQFQVSEHVFQGEPCWEKPRKNPKHYAVTCWRGMHIPLHRFMYAWLIAPIPRGWKNGEIDHLCRNRGCCNPAHLELVSRRVNVARGNRFRFSNQTHCKYGHPLSGDNIRLEHHKKGHVGRRCRTCRRTPEYKSWQADYQRAYRNTRKQNKPRT